MSESDAALIDAKLFSVLQSIASQCEVAEDNGNSSASFEEPAQLQADESGLSILDELLGEPLNNFIDTLDLNWASCDDKFQLGCERKSIADMFINDFSFVDNCF